VILAATPSAFAGDTQNLNQTSASTGSGRVVVRAGYVVRTSWRSVGGSESGSSSSAPRCIYFSAGPDATKLLGKGGAEPGAWYIPLCKLPPHDYGNPMSAVWLVGLPPAAPASPALLARQAISTLALAGPQIGMSPPPNKPQIVNISTWLWITGAGRGRSATAKAGPVAATATAVPYKVVWSMGDGHSVTCFGPGTPYKPNEPASSQSTSCSYTYSTPSSSVPGGRYTVTATIYYRVSWVAVGAPGGGNLGLVAGPTARTTVLVEQAEALNSG
jgi:hypothetical protein